ncbi:MAG: DUF2752 domain-containing protein [Phycisphaerales bacterium]
MTNATAATAPQAPHQNLGSRSTPPPASALPTAARMVSGILAALCLAVMLTAFFLRPSAKGHATHTQLGLPACGWATFFNKPCPTCGMTTSFALAAKGHFWLAFKTQPAGFLIAIATCITFWGALHGAIFASRVDRLVFPLLQPRWLWTAAGILLAAWAYKIATWQ